MHNCFLGVWICFLSITMLFGILFPFHDILLCSLGIVIGYRLVVEDIISIGRSRIINRADNKTTNKKEMHDLSCFICKLPYGGTTHINIHYMNDDGEFGPRECAKVFESVNEANDYIDFVPIGKKREWMRNEVEVVIKGL